MIVYNVGRHWFSKKELADTYRKAVHLPPSAIEKIEVSDRDQLCALLNALCEPQVFGAAAAEIVPAPVLDRAYVDPGFDLIDVVPLFLRRDHARRNGLPEPLR